MAYQGGWSDGSRSLAGYIEDVDRVTESPLVGIGLYPPESANRLMLEFRQPSRASERYTIELT